jgi:hypothetical protein
MPPELLPDPATLKTLCWVAALLFIRDLSMASMARLRKKVLATPDKSDDWLADVIDVATGILKKIPFPTFFGSKTLPKK